MAGECWWKNAVIYQIFVPSFYDSNGDGIGDINGIYSKLGYIKELGATAISLSPINKSLMKDSGYDVNNYRSINPVYGTMPEFNRMVKRAHNLGIKVILEFVVNHTSADHPWFKESRTSKDSKIRDFYIWQDGIKNGKKLEPPNDWLSLYGGSAWTYDDKTGQFYLHMISPYQPDLNWECEMMREEMYNIMQFWLAKGIDGLNLNGVSLISKPMSSKGYLAYPGGNEKDIVPDGPRIHNYLREMKEEVFSNYNIVTIGDLRWVAVEEAVKYANTTGDELDMAVFYEHLETDGSDDFKWTDNKTDLVELKFAFNKFQNTFYGNGWNVLSWLSHEKTRVVSRFCDSEKHREKAAMMLATCLYFMQGTPVIYQGDELGMTNAGFSEIEDYRDIETLNAYKIFFEESNHYTKEEMQNILKKKSRDNSRTPMQWNDSPFAGFSRTEPWIKENPNYKEINVEEQRTNPGSVYNYYRKLIKLRKEMDIITYGDFELLLAEHSDLFVYTRGYKTKRLLIVCNFTSEDRTFILPKEYTGKNILISNDENIHRTHTTELSPQGYRPKPCVVLGPYCAVVFRRY